jgi:Uma2 family endonuclease
MVAVAKKRSHAVALGVDPTIYPEADGMGEGQLQRLICELLRPLLARFLTERAAARGRREAWNVGSDQFIYWQKHNSSARIAPDIYVLRGVPQSRVIRSWKVWETGIAPLFCLEVVSHDAEKDYVDAPSLYANLGVNDLVIFDPEARERRGRARFQVYRRVGSRGLVSVEVTNEDRVRSRTLGCWLRAVGHGDEQRIRVALGARGEDLLPTDAERAERADEERAEKERERAARLAAEAEVARLRAELAKRGR